MNLTTTQTPTMILKGIPRAGYDTHLCSFPGSLYACLTYLGDPCDYDFIMGVSGAAFRRFWNRDDGGNIDLSYLGDESFRRTFQAVGYAYRTIPAEKAAMIRAIKESIARGVPPISFGIIGPPEAGSVAAVYYEKVGALSDPLWPWVLAMPRAAKKALVDASTRRSLATLVRSAKTAETQAVEHLERALAALR